MWKSQTSLGMIAAIIFSLHVLTDSTLEAHFHPINGHIIVALPTTKTMKIMYHEKVSGNMVRAQLAKKLKEHFCYLQHS